MSGHADTIREANERVVKLRTMVAEAEKQQWTLAGVLRYDAELLDALVVENQQQDDRIKWLEGEEAGWRTGTLAQTERLGKATEECQQLRAALQLIAERQFTAALDAREMRDLARAALAGTPSEDTE